MRPHGSKKRGETLKWLSGGHVYISDTPRGLAAVWFERKWDGESLERRSGLIAHSASPSLSLLSANSRRALLGSSLSRIQQAARIMNHYRPQRVL